MSADPLTMMLISTAAQSFMSGIAANQAGKANQMIANANAAAQRQQAKVARQNAAFNAQRQREKGQRILSEGRTSYAKGGVEIAGSPVEVLGEMAADIEFDALTTIYGGQIDSQTMLNQANMSQYEGRIARYKGKTQQTSSLMGAGVSLIGAGFSSGVIPTPSNPFASLGTSGPFSPGSFPARTTNLPSYTVNQSPFASGSYTANPNIFR